MDRIHGLWRTYEYYLSRSGKHFVPSFVRVIDSSHVCPQEILHSCDIMLLHLDPIIIWLFQLQLTCLSYCTFFYYLKSSYPNVNNN